LADLRRAVLKDTAELVETKVAPLQKALDTLNKKYDNLQEEARLLKDKVAKLERGSGGEGKDKKAKRNDAEDPAHKRVAFLGFSEATPGEERVKAMQDYCKKYPGHQALAHYNKYKGPYNNRKLTTVGLVEFANRDARDNFLKAAGGQDCETQGAKVKVKRAKTNFNSQRDYSLYKAVDLLKEAAAGKKVTLDRGNRKVKVEDEVAFKQEKEDSGGTFLGEFEHLALP